MRKKILISVTVALAAMGMLSGCDVTTPSQVKTERIQLRQDMITKSFDAAQPDRNGIAAIAKNYRQNGTGPMRLTVSLLSGDPSGKVAAETQARVWTQAFAKDGVKDVRVSYVEVADASYAGRAVVSWQALAAHAPADCTAMTGREGADSLEDVSRYAFGCETKTAISEMIVDPRDLLGTSGTGESAARRHGAIVENHEAGKPSEPFANEQSASTTGQ